MVTTFSGSVVVTGTNDIASSGIYQVVSFDSFNQRVDNVDFLVGNLHTEVSVLSTDIFFSGGMAQPVIFDSTAHRVDNVGYLVKNVHTEVTVVDCRFDFRFTPPTTTTGITVVDFGFNSNTNFTAVSRINSRIFPTPVSTATLFPGDRPRGTPLN